MVERMTSPISEKTIETPQKLLAGHGAAAQLVSGNGPQLKSKSLSGSSKETGSKTRPKDVLLLIRKTW